MYTSEYNPDVGYGNDPVTDISSYISGGYAWIDGSFTIITTEASETVYTTDYYIVVASTDALVVDTPVIFTETGKVIGDATLGGLVIGTSYYVKEIASPTTFSVSVS